MARNSQRLERDDIGKPVLNAGGDKIGIVSDVEDGVGYVDPEPGLSDRIRSRLQWGHHDDDDHPLRRSEIATVTDDEVRLKSE